MRARAKSENALEGVAAHDPNVVSQSITAPFARGELVAGKYVVERLIGIGGVGLVLAARHKELDELVAIKVLRPEALSRPELVRRFAREAKAAVRIKSEYAARVFDVGTLPDKGPYMVMEFLEGQDLGVMTEGNQSLPVKRAVEFIMQSCEAIAVAHSLGIVHRDIKPENLFLARRPDGSEVVKVLDFGISKTALTGSAIGGDIALDRTQDLMGSPFYMSPEQFRGTKDIDHRTDIWSLGIVMYELLTGTQPFQGESVPAVCSAVLEGKAKPLASHMRDVPLGLQDVIDRCLEKDPAKRFQNVAELAIALLPFAPTFARVFAERTSGILHAADRSIVTFKYDSTAPPSHPTGPISAIPHAPLVPSMTSLTTSQILASTSPEALQQITAEARKTRMVIVGALALVVIAATGIVFFLRERSAKTEQAAAPAAQAAPISHSVIVDTEPTHARINWQGKLLGETPGTFSLPVGQHELVVTLDGFHQERLAVTIAENASESPHLHVTLQADSAPKTAPVVTQTVAKNPFLNKPPTTLPGFAPGKGPGPVGARSATPSAQPKTESASAPTPAAAPAPAPAVKEAPAPTTKVKVIGDKKTDVVIVN